MPRLVAKVVKYYQMILIKELTSVITAYLVPDRDFFT